jgi:hypothetical protein
MAMVFHVRGATAPTTALTGSHAAGIARVGGSSRASRAALTGSHAAGIARVGGSSRASRGFRTEGAP